jgi:uracil-DNA glycosylase family protein
LQRATDADVTALRGQVQAVRRDEHKMHAFVRFRRVDTADGEQFVAWHRPDHPILRLAAPFFARRFPAMRWTIVTPDASASWDGEALRYGPGAPRSSTPQDDELEALFVTYYQSIFNPARLNLRAMRAEMPRKHWATLPETTAIAGLVRAAPERTAAMLAGQASAAAAWVPALHEVEEVQRLPVLRAAAAACRACGLAACATRTVFGEGPAAARMMLVGEQPGDEEDLEGRPFVGPAGQVLDALLAEVGIDRSQVYVTNAVKHFKWQADGSRRVHVRPGPTEVAACRAWLDAEIAAVRPAVIVCLGSTAARSFVGPRFNATRGPRAGARDAVEPGVAGDAAPGGGAARGRGGGKGASPEGAAGGSAAGGRGAAEGRGRRRPRACRERLKCTHDGAGEMCGSCNGGTWTARPAGGGEGQGRYRRVGSLEPPRRRSRCSCDPNPAHAHYP